MVPKSKITKYIIFLTRLSATILLVYVVVKCYTVYNNENSRRKDEESWWKLKMFSNKDQNENSEISVLGLQLYILLFYAVIDDVYNIWYLILRLCRTFFNFLGSVIFYLMSMLSKYVTFVVVLSILVLIAYFLLIQYAKMKYKRDNKVNGTEIYDSDDREIIKHKKCDSGLDDSISYSSSSRKYIKVMIKVVFFAALLTLPWEYVRLYQSAVAEKMSLMSAGTPAECFPSQMSYLQSFTSWWRSGFSWSTEDRCYEYQKALLVDPLWQVTPLMVISSAFSHCIVYPFEVLLGGIGRGLREFFSEIPAFWQPFMFIALVIFCALLLVMGCGYRIHVPLLFKFEPKTPVIVQKGERISSKPRKEIKNSNSDKLNHQNSNTLISRRPSNTPKK